MRTKSTDLQDIYTTQEREKGKVLGINRMRTKSTDLQDIRTTQEREKRKVLGINRTRTKSTDLQDIRTTQLSSLSICGTPRDKSAEIVP